MIKVSTILEQTEGKDYYAILNAVYAYYLTEKERVHYHVLLLYVLGKPQRDIGILLNTQQYRVCEYLSKLKRKLVNVTTVLARENAELVRFMARLKPLLSKQQYDVAEFLLAGNKKIDIAAHYRCSPARITIVSKLIQNKLSAKERNRFLHFYSKLG
jgi:hypothetical protein